MLYSFNLAPPLVGKWLYRASDPTEDFRLSKPNPCRTINICISIINMLSLPTGCWAAQWPMWKGGSLTCWTDQIDYLIKVTFNKELEWTRLQLCYRIYIPKHSTEDLQFSWPSSTNVFIQTPPGSFRFPPLSLQSTPQEWTVHLHCLLTVDISNSFYVTRYSAQVYSFIYTREE